MSPLTLDILHLTEALAGLGVFGLIVGWLLLLASGEE